MKPVLISPALWASVRDVQGVPSLFTHCNAQGNGFITYTGLDYVLANRCGLTLSGRAVKFNRAQMANIRALAGRVAA
jgi:hypothetical protein